MSDFDTAFRTLLRFEGKKYEDVEGDPGGPTKFGVSLTVLQDFNRERPGPLATAADVETLEKQDAHAIFREMWWEADDYGEIISTESALRVFLAAVLYGPSRGCKMAQRACNCAGRDLLEDGLLGPLTRQAINETPSGIFIPAFRAAQMGHVEKKWALDKNLKKKWPGWGPRALF